MQIPIAVQPVDASPRPVVSTTRIVGRVARSDENGAVRTMLGSDQSERSPGELPLVSVVALVDDEVIGVASAWPAGTPGCAWASAAVREGWRGLGVAAFLGRHLALELDELGIRSVVAPPDPLESTRSA